MFIMTGVVGCAMGLMIRHCCDCVVYAHSKNGFVVTRTMYVKV